MLKKEKVWVVIFRIPAASARGERQELLKDKYEFEERGAIAVKGKGEMPVYLLKGKKENLIPEAIAVESVRSTND